MSAEVTQRVERVVQRLREARRIRGISQSDLAARAGMERTAICNIEIGRRQEIRLSEVLSLAAALDVDVCALLSEAPMRIVSSVEVI